MSDNTINLNEWDAPNHARNFGFTDRKTDLSPRSWPAGARADKNVWGIRWSEAMRAEMTDNGTSADQPVIDFSLEEGLNWIPLDPKRRPLARNVTKIAREAHGTYEEMSDLANKLNLLQDKFDTVGRSIVFYPELANMAGA